MLRHIPEIFYLLPKVGDIFRANKGEKDDSSLFIQNMSV
jgi:hypothetical protein